MQVKQAKAIAQQWVTENAEHIPGFFGAFFHGSINWLDDEDTLPIGSDLDVMMVLDGVELPRHSNKVRFQGVLLETSFLPRERVESAETILSQYNLAGSFHVPSILADPSGQLTALQAAVSNDYTNRKWVRQRCEDAHDKVLRYVDGMEADAPRYNQVMGCAFGAGITTHVLLVADLKNPTVRKRYVAVRDLLDTYGYLEFHETLLALQGCAHMSREQIAAARSTAIAGSQALIDQGYHRETMFWIVVTYSRCLTILAQDAPDLQQQFIPGYQQLLDDLGIGAFAAIQQRCDQIKNRLPDVWRVAEAIMDANPEIAD